MASILDQDFGSESEEGDFNPEPGKESDNGSGSEQGYPVHQKANGNDKQRKRGVGRGHTIEEDDDEPSGRRRNHGDDASRASDKEDDVKGEEEKKDGIAASNGAHDDDDDDGDEDEEDEDEDDEDEEDAISVRRTGCNLCYQY